MFKCLHCNNGVCRKYSTLDVDVPCSGNGDCDGYEVVDEVGFPHWASEAAYNNGYAKGYADGKAEIERLNKEVDRLSQCVLYSEGYIADAIKEFVERLKDRAEECWDGAITHLEIDEVAKEMVGADNGK